MNAKQRWFLAVIVIFAMTATACGAPASTTTATVSETITTAASSAEATTAATPPATTTTASTSPEVTTASTATTGGLQAGDLAPDFTLPDSNGNPVHLAEELTSNRTVVLVFYQAHT